MGFKGKCVEMKFIQPLLLISEALVAQSIERLTAKSMTPAGPWFDPQLEQIFSGLLSTKTSWFHTIQL